MTDCLLCKADEMEADERTHHFNRTADTYSDVRAVCDHFMREEERGTEAADPKEGA
jgi:hypothetical protein